MSGRDLEVRVSCKATPLPVLIPDKPPEHDPCNGCGECCIAVQCDLGLLCAPTPEGEVCRALRHDGERFACGLIVDPETYGVDDPAAIARRLGIGRGCDSDAPPGNWVGR